MTSNLSYWEELVTNTCKSHQELLEQDESTAVYCPGADMLTKSESRRVFQTCLPLSINIKTI